MVHFTSSMLVKYAMRERNDFQFLTASILGRCAKVANKQAGFSEIDGKLIEKRTTAVMLHFNPSALGKACERGTTSIPFHIDPYLLCMCEFIRRFTDDGNDLADPRIEGKRQRDGYPVGVRYKV